jgi:hypothetical protein
MRTDECATNAEANGPGLRQRPIQGGTRGSAGKDGDAEIAAGGVLAFRSLRQCPGNGLGGAGGREAAETNPRPVRDEVGSLVRGEDGKRQRHRYSSNECGPWLRRVPGVRATAATARPETAPLPVVGGTGVGPFVRAVY